MKIHRSESGEERPGLGPGHLSSRDEGVMDVGKVGVMPGSQVRKVCEEEGRMEPEEYC